MGESDSRSCLCAFGLIILGIGVLLTVILVPISFKGIEYYQYGFKRKSSTGTVSTDRVYDVGKYMVGPDYEFKTFTATAHFVNLDRIQIYTSDPLEIEVDVYFQYFLRKEDLPYLHKFYDLNYDPTIRASAVTALKNESPKYSADQYFRDRAKVEAALFTAVRNRLGGQCCAADCSRWQYACPKDCLVGTRCDPERDKGLWVDVKYFQLGKPYIPPEVEDKYLTQLTLKEEGAREQYIQDAAVVRKDTTALVAEIKNQAKEVREIAEAESQRIQTISKANYTASIEKARSQGLRLLYQRLKIDNQTIKNSFDYLRTLRGLDGIHLTVNFQQRIVGGLG